MPQAETFDPVAFKQKMREEWSDAADGWRKWCHVVEGKDGGQHHSAKLVELARIRSAAKPGASPRLQSCWRQRNSWLTWIPAARATSDATAPGAIAAATIRSFSARGQRRRRGTDVTTSICFVTGLSLGLVL